jgi:hypothetical protein
VNVIFTQPRAAAFVADLDSIVNTRYGKQEDVACGFNPHKPGRGSHHPLLCVVAGTRLTLYMEWRSVNEVSAGHWIEAMERVWAHPDVPGRLQLNRGEIGFAQKKSWPGKRCLTSLARANGSS